MENSRQKIEDNRFQARALEVTLRIGFVLLLLGWCFWIIRPFIVVVVWGIIIAVAVYPMHGKLLSAIGDRRKLAAAISTLLMLALFLVPAGVLTESLVTGAQGLYNQVSSGEIQIPPPPEGIGSWPIVGKPLEETWRQASTNLSAALDQFAPQLTKMAGPLLSSIAGTGLGLLQFLLATIVAGAVLANAEAGQVTARRFAVRMAGDRGKEFARVTKETIRSVARGILGVALIQSLLAGLGFLVVGLPAAGLLAMICLLLGIIQLGIGLVVIPTVIYVFYTAETVTAVVFLVWCTVVTLLDNVLKPILLGRGAPVPMIVIFLGSIGGFLTQGIIGLFLGAVILSLGFNLYQTWVDQAAESEPEEETGSKGVS
ncbi:MAG TPA: AI-2E family transporter [Acidobacteriota bacterium]|nr:AI-2E family transporter [Acidobacteriota bacterium]